MSSAGNRGLISGNAGSSNWNFGIRNGGDASTNTGSTADRRRVCGFYSFLLVIFPLLHPLHFDLDSSKHPSISIQWYHPTTPIFLLSSLPSFWYFLVADDTVAQSSGASAQRFANLQNQKRNSQDASAAARRASFAEMNKAPGFFGGIWQNWTKGTGK